jgi:hypothetical protein
MPAFCEELVRSAIRNWHAEPPASPNDLVEAEAWLRERANQVASSARTSP